MIYCCHYGLNCVTGDNNVNNILYMSMILILFGHTEPKLMYCLLQDFQGWGAELNLLFRLQNDWMWCVVALSKEECSLGVHIVAFLSWVMELTTTSCVTFQITLHTTELFNREGVYGTCWCGICLTYLVSAMDQRVAKLLLLNYIGPCWIDQWSSYSGRMSGCALYFWSYWMPSEAVVV
jgi:hypothetical protein